MQSLERWHELVAQQDPTGLAEILAEDCVFYSPLVHAPQPGRDLTTWYLTGAMQVFNESFHYVKEVVTDTHAVLEFECVVDGITINGVDIITFDADGKFCEFKVMIRPRKAIDMMQAKMAAMLESMSAKEASA